MLHIIWYAAEPKNLSSLSNLWANNLKYNKGFDFTKSHLRFSWYSDLKFLKLKSDFEYNKPFQVNFVEWYFNQKTNTRRSLLGYDEWNQTEDDQQESQNVKRNRRY